MTTHDRPLGRHYEDFELGDIYKHWPGKTITEYDDHLFCMITMNHHPTHTNAWFAEHETPHKQNLVVGNLVYSLVLGLSVPDVSGAAIANLEVETLKHAKPTFHGDTIYAETRVLDKRLTSKGDRGIVTVETKGINQKGEEVCYFRRKVMVWTRESAPKHGRPYDSDALWAEADAVINPTAAAGFGNAAADYERARPGYPREVGEVLTDEVGIAPGARVCDLAAGTGKFTRLLVGRGFAVVAVEPVAAMRAQLVEVLPDVEVVDGTAEAIPVDDGAVDAVTVAQAFHWFDFDAALAEIARVLRSDGRLVLVWNRRDESVPWVRAMSDVVEWHNRPISAYQRMDWPGILAGGGFVYGGYHELNSEQPMNRDLLAARVRSISYIGEMAADEQQDHVDRVLALVDDQPDEFPMPYTTMLWWASSR